MNTITKNLILIALALFLAACQNNKPNSKTKEQSSTEKTIAEANTKSPSQYDAENGKKVYLEKCGACHMANGQGMPPVFPPLAKADFLEKKTESIQSVIAGVRGEMIVNGVKYNSMMAPINMSEKDLIDVMNYVYNSWGNSGEISKEDIDKAKQALKGI